MPMFPMVRCALFLGLYVLSLGRTPGAPFFSPANAVPVDTNPVAIVSLDLNADGRMDLVVAHGVENTLSVFTNQGAGWIGRAGIVQLAHRPRSLVVAEANGDRLPDVIATHSLAPVSFSVLTNNGFSSFQLASTTTLAATPSGVKVVDLDGDGWTELIVADGHALEVMTNDHTGQFSLAASLYSGFYPYTVATADFNGDGSPDLIGGNHESNPTLITNSGGGKMTSALNLPWTVRPDFLKAVDVNNDARMDLILASLTQLVVLTNNGVGVFTPTRTNTVNCAALEAADLDGDGFVDLVAADSFQARLTVLRNHGRGTFTAIATPSVNQRPVGLVVADMNGDGPLDLISANDIDHTLSMIWTYSHLSLAIHRNPTNTAVLTWPLTAPLWQLEFATNLASSSPVWTTVSPPFITNGLEVIAVLPPPVGQQFYRLRN